MKLIILSAKLLQHSNLLARVTNQAPCFNSANSSTLHLAIVLWLAICKLLINNFRDTAATNHELAMTSFVLAFQACLKSYKLILRFFRSSPSFTDLSVSFESTFEVNHDNKKGNRCPKPNTDRFERNKLYWNTKVF